MRTLHPLTSIVPRFLAVALTVTISVTVISCSPTRMFVAESARGWQEEFPASDQEVYRVYLVGDVGAVLADGTAPVLGSLKKDLEDKDERAAVVFLGDNLYCCGLPD
jgi:hypothetical protein